MEGSKAGGGGPVEGENAYMGDGGFLGKRRGASGGGPVEGENAYMGDGGFYGRGRGAGVGGKAIYGRWRVLR